MSPEAAKARLRRIARETGIGPWVRRKPVDALLVATVTGFLIGNVPKLWGALTRTPVGKRMGKKMRKQVIERFV